MENITLNNGVEMPILGFGVFQIPNGETEKAVSLALEAGYRAIDTAAIYHNEEGVGRAIATSGIPREELFITTKLWTQPSASNTERALDASLSRLGLDYVDLYLIHQPFGDIYGQWREMERLYSQGRVRAIGVSNFYPGRLVDFMKHNEIVPAVNQIETHPFFQRTEDQKIADEYGVKIESWGPLAEVKNNILDNPTLVAIAQEHGKSVAQVILRWLTQRGIIAIPKSVHESRIAENFAIFDFTLSQAQMDAIATLDQGTSLFVDHYSVEAAKNLGRIDDIAAGLA